MEDDSLVETDEAVSESKFIFLLWITISALVKNALDSKESTIISSFEW